MSFLSKLKRNMGVEKAEQDEDDLEEEEKPKTKKKIKVQKAEKSELAKKKIKKIVKKKKRNEEKEIEDEDEDEDEDELEDEELDAEAERELEELLDEEEVEELEEKESKAKKPDFSLKNLGGPEGELAVDVYQTAKDVVIEAAIAGVDSDEIEIFIESDTVTIKGERGGCTQDQDKSYFYQECYWGAFQRRIILPEEVDATHAKAELKKGILCIRVPKTERKKRRKIDVRE